MQQNVILNPESESKSSKTTPFKSFKDVVAKHVEEPCSSPSLDASSPNDQESKLCHKWHSSSNGMAQWQWHDVYRWILQLNDGQFVKYNKSLYDGLCAQNITGSKLVDLTPTDWLVLGVTESFDIHTITTQIGRLHLSSSPPPSELDDDSEGATHSNKVSPSTPSVPRGSSPINAIQCTQTQTNNMWIINGNVVGTLSGRNSMINSNAMSNTMNNTMCNSSNAMNESCFNLYVHQTQQQLNVEHNKRMLAESALAEVQSKSGAHRKVLEEALTHCVQQYHAMAQLSGSLQIEARTKDQELVAMKGEHDRLMSEYEGKAGQLEREMATRTELEEGYRSLSRRYQEMRSSMQQRHRELESKYSDLESRYNALEERVDHLKRFRRWDFNEVYLWIIGIDDGYFGRKYVDLYDHLEIQQISGNGLADFGVDEINRIGIEDVVDQRRLLANIRVLLHNGSEGTALTDSHEDYDYSNIDLFTTESIESI